MMLFLNSPVFSWIATASLLCSSLSAQQAAAPVEQKITVPLTVPAGTPIRVYLVKRVWFHSGEVVHAKTVEPVWAFDRIVIPAGTEVDGSIVQLQPVSKMMRATAMVRGDFTPLKRAQVSFTSLALPNAAPLSLATDPSPGLASIYVPPRPSKKAKKPKPVKNSKTSGARRFIKQQAQIQANARTRGFLDFVRGPNKKEWLENYLWSTLPYHPQFYRSGTRFDAVLSRPLEFGTTQISADEVEHISTATITGGAGMVRFLSTVTSADAKPGDPVEGALSQPLFSADHNLVLPEGTKLTGKVTLARPAKMFHRGGQLRFTFNRVDVPEYLQASAPPRVEVTQAQVTAAESRNGPVAVDSEGTAKSTESKARLLRPIVAGLIATKSLDNDSGKTATGGANANYGGRSLGGFSGFGLFGTAVTLGPRNLGAAFGFYGLAWSVYNTVISRGREVTFQQNDAVSINFAPAERRTAKR